MDALSPRSLFSMNAYNSLNTQDAQIIQPPYMSSLVNPTMNLKDQLTQSSGGLRYRNLQRGPQPYSANMDTYKGVGNIQNTNQNLNQEVPLSVENYFNKQNEIMLQMQRNMEYYKKAELMKQKIIYEQNLDSQRQQFRGQSHIPTNLTPWNPGQAHQQPQRSRKNPNSLMAEIPYMISSSSGHLLMAPTQNQDVAMSSKKNSALISPRVAPLNRETRREPVPTIDDDLEDSEMEVSVTKNQVETNREASQTKNVTAEIQKKIMLKKNNTRARKLLRVIGWTMAVPGVWWRSAVDWAKKRVAKQLKDVEKNIPNNLEVFVSFAGQVLEKEMKKFVGEKNSMVIVMPKGSKKVDVNKRCKLMTNHLKDLIDNLRVGLTDGTLSREFYQFLASISGNGAVIPETFLSGFELERLPFTLFGNLKNMDQWRTKMILANFVLLKGLLYSVILRPWECVSSVEQDSVNLKNLINAGSVFYHVVREVIEDNVAKVKDPESRAPFKTQVTDLHAIDSENISEIEVIPEDSEKEENEAILGFYNQEDLLAYLDYRFDLVVKLKESVSNFLDELYKITQRFNEDKKRTKNANNKFK